MRVIAKFHRPWVFEVYYLVQPKNGGYTTRDDYVTNCSWLDISQLIIILYVTTIISLVEQIVLLQAETSVVPVLRNLLV